MPNPKVSSLLGLFKKNTILKEYYYIVILLQWPTYVAIRVRFMGNFHQDAPWCPNQRKTYSTKQSGNLKCL